MFHCEDCGELNSILVDGYAVGDRLLEGVMFRVSCQKDGSLKAAVMQEDVEYMDRLNAPRWCKEVADHITNDEYIAECPKCGGQIIAEDNGE